MMSLFRGPSAALLALIALLPCLCACSSIRGLDPALAARYEPDASGNFACLDGKKTIPFEQVNDDYCDCLDGSDEPGTAACPNGHFYCENKFFLPLLLNATMVDDGVCDCCDGSDEPKGRCANECYNKGYESLILLKNQARPAPSWLQAAAADKGVQARNKYVADAAGSKQEWAKRKAEVDGEVEKQRKAKEDAEALKSKLEEELRKLQERKKEVEAAKKKLEAPEQPAATAAKEAAAAAVEGDADEAAEAQEGEQEGVEGVEDGAEEEEGAEEAEGEDFRSDAELARERMSQWVPKTKDGDKAADAAAADGAADDEAAAAAVGDVHETAEQEAGSEGEEGAEEGAEEEEEGGEDFRSEAELARERMAQWIPGSKDGKDEGSAEDDHPVADDAGEQADETAVEEGEEQLSLDPDAPGADAGADGAAGGSDDGSGGGEEPASAEEAAVEGKQPASALGKAWGGLNKLLRSLTRGKLGGGASESGDELSAALAALEAELDALNTKLTPARTKATEARRKLTDLEAEQTKLQDRLDGSYGQDDAYVALVGRCIDAKVEKYTYEVCPFEKASQKDGASSTSLGTWAGFEEGESKMAFKNGQGCWQGPSRTMTVSLVCGNKERLTKVAEPSRCEYTAELETPAACTAAAAEALRSEVQARQRFLNGEDEAEAQEAAAQGPAGSHDEL
ncbi:Glucosidase 2 subunit beta [Chlorella vulgaris]